MAEQQFAEPPQLPYEQPYVANTQVFREENRIDNSVIAYIKNCDMNGDGKITMNEVSNLFAFADVNHNGKVEKAELRLFMKRNFPKVTDMQITQAYTKFDYSDDGKIQIDEFAEVVKACWPSLVNF